MAVVLYAPSLALSQGKRMFNILVALRENLSLGFPTTYRSNTNQALQLQKMATGLIFRTWEVEGLYHL